MKKIFILSFLFSLAGVLSAQTLNKAKLDSLFDVLAAKEKAMGSIALSKNGRQIYSRAIGYSQITNTVKTPANTNTIYRIGSISKMFTATMIFQLIEEGKISLTTPISNYFPELPNATKITIGNLLNHHSGLHNFTDDSSYLAILSKPHTQKQMLQIISSNPVDFEPGAQGEYSNSNYVVLGFLVEKITGKKYQDALKERILSKAELQHTYYGSKADPKKNEALSYEYMPVPEGGAIVNTWEFAGETDMSIPHGAGALVSTPEELNKFIEALFAHKLISAKSLEQMTTIQDDYGMGIFEIPFGKRISYGHSGGIDGFSSLLGYFPKDSLAFAYCSNGGNYSSNDVIIGVLSIYYNVPYTIPTFKTLALKTEDLDKYLGVYSSADMPLKITVSKNGTALKAQATGQSSFPLEATGPDEFRFDAADITMIFRPEKSEFTLLQSGMTFIFVKQK